MEDTAWLTAVYFVRGQVPVGDFSEPLARSRSRQAGR
jgi:hypothetical protein